jgi:hypothetical protein
VLLGRIAGSPGRLLESFVDAVEFVLQLSKLCLLHAQLFLVLHFLRRQLLFFAAQLLDPGFHLRQLLFGLLALAFILAVAKVFQTLDRGCKPFLLGRVLAKPSAVIIHALRDAGHHRLLGLNTVNQNLGSLGGHAGGSQFQAELAYFGQERLQGLRVG